MRITDSSVRIHLGRGSDISIINEKTWEHVKLELCCSYKIANGITGRKLYFTGERVCNIMFKGQIKETDVSVLRKSMNLFGTDCMEKFMGYIYKLFVQ